MTDLPGMQLHLELLKVEPFLGLDLVQVVVRFSGFEAKGVEGAVLIQQQDGGDLVVHGSVLSQLSPLHQEDLVGCCDQRIRIPAVGGPKVDGYDHLGTTRGRWLASCGELAQCIKGNAVQIKSSPWKLCRLVHTSATGNCY